MPSTAYISARKKSVHFPAFVCSTNPVLKFALSVTRSEVDFSCRWEAWLAHIAYSVASVAAPEALDDAADENSNVLRVANRIVIS
jgi:hypothetical protein